MLRSLRRKLVHIRYHSAPRPSNAWSRAIDIAFIATFVLSLPAALLADFMHVRKQTAMSLPGILARAPDGAIHGRMLETQDTRTAQMVAPRAIGSSDVVIGNFTLSAQDHLYGWPLTTTIVHQPAQLDLDILSEAKARTNVAREPSDPYQRAVEDALRSDGRDEALEAWAQHEPAVARHWWAWLPAAGAWWLMMFFGAAFVIQFLRFGSLWLMGKRLQREAHRRASGKCMSCGYDMTGLEFNERCPECGKQVW